MVVIIGIIAGIITGLGLGGGLFLITGLTLFMGFEQRIAQSVNLIFFVPTAITAIILNSRRKIIKWKTAFQVAIGGIVGAMIGSNIATKINVETLKKMFGMFLAIIAVYETYTLVMIYINDKNERNG